MNYSFYSVKQKLESLGMSLNDSRVIAYIHDLSKIRGKRYSIANLPNKHYQKIYQFLEVYERINELLRLSGTRWDDKAIIEFFALHSHVNENGECTNRLKFEKWLKLEEICKSFYIPF